MAFSYYSPLTFNHAQIPSSQSNFPALISLTDARFKTIGNSGHVANSNGYDIRPYSDSGLTSAITGYELERYNASTGEVVMWCKIPSLSSTVLDTVIYLGYGDASLTTDGSSTTTWSNGFLGVYHLKDGTTLSVASSTGSNNGTNHSVTATAGQIDGGGGFVSASSQYIDVGTFDTSPGFTLSAWVKGTSFPNTYNVVICKNSGNTNYSELLVKSTGKLACFLTRSGGAPDIHYDGTGSHTLSTATWYLLHMTYDSSSGLIGYVNASSDGTAAASGTSQASQIATDIGQDPVNAGRFWNGVLDEVRLATGARSADWITTEYNNQNAPGTFETLGTEVAVTSTATWNMFLLFP